jgi:hypothetical protein
MIMSDVLEGKRIAFLATDGVERRELEEPLTAVHDAGGGTEILSLELGHGPWTLVEAGVVKGRTLTSYPSLRTDLRNAGAIPVDEEVAVDGNLISSGSPDDLPAFCRAIVGGFSST